MAYFQTDTNQVAGEEFDVLDRLFSDVDAYVGDPALRAAADDIDESELRSRAHDAYRRLYTEPEKNPE